MSRRLRSGRDPFGLSLLDMLCCSFGAVVLLIVLNQQTADERLEKADAVASVAFGEWSKANGVWQRADAERTDAESKKARAESRAEEAKARTEMYEGIGRSLPRGPAPPVDKQEFLPAAGGKRALMLLDCSGSMSRYSRAETLPADGGCPPKWRRAIESIERFLLQQRELGAFAVIAIDDGRLRPIRESRIYPVGERWAPGGLAEIGNASRALFERRPSGGSAHGWTLKGVIDEYLAGGPGAADVILIVTDGLPNFGSSSVKGGSAAGLVTVDDKRRFASEAIETVKAAKARGTTVPPIHFICLEWPDDTEMLNFALSLAHETGGFVAYLSSEGERRP